MYQKTTLDNGLRIITAGMPHTPSVCVNFFIGVGSRYESGPDAGISHFIEHLLFKGTPKRPTSRAVSEAIEGVGGVFNGGTDKEMTIYYCKVARPHFPIALDVLSDMLLKSMFEPGEIEKERQVIVEEINRCKDSPAQWVNLIIDELLWPEHPLGRDIAGTRDSVSTISREQMLRYLAGQYRPDNTVVSIAGNVEHADMVQQVSRALEGWTNQGTHAGYPPYREVTGERLRIENRDTEQAHLCLAMPGLSYFHPQRFILDLLNIILSGGMSSRLFTEIRDKLGLAYEINSYVENFLDCGSVAVYAGVEPKNLKRAITASLEQLAILKEQLVPEAELVKVKELSKGRLLLRMEDSRNVSGWTGAQEILSGRILSVDEIVAIVDAITAEQIQAVARQLFVGDKLRLAVVGPVDDGDSLLALLKL